MNILLLGFLRSFQNALARVVLFIALIGAAVSVHGQNFDLSRDFSRNSNPHDVWSYGWENVLGGEFTLLASSGQGVGDNGVPLEAWSLGPGVLPAVIHFPLSNTGPATSDGGVGQYPPGAVVFYAGADGTPYNYAAIRFTSPSNGNYRVGVAVRPYLSGPPAGDTDFYVLRNGVALLSQFLSATSGTSYSNTLSLARNDTIDFVVGRGADGVQYGSGLNIQTIVTGVGSTAPLPFITQQPESITTTTGNRARFRVVVASPTPVQFQWYFGSELLEGETASTLKIKPVRLTDGGTYSVRASNGEGSVWTAAVLTVKRRH